VACSWCDSKESWDASKFPPVPVDDVIRRAGSYPAKSAVVTGGEPLLYNLGPLCKGLRELGIRTFLETSGSSPLSGSWDWICLSPKRDAPPLEEFFEKADELKVVIGDLRDFDWAEENSFDVRPECILYLQPEWCNRNSVVPLIVKYIQSHPKWRMSIQAHKYIGIP
jgi:organic radical activating enzyme